MSAAKNIDIMFVVSPSNATSPWMPFYYLYLAGYLEEHGYSVDIVDSHQTRLKDNMKIALQEIKRKSPRFVGFAVLVTDYNIVENLAREVKKISKATVLVGNAQASIAPEDFLYEGSPFDIVVRGEGELTVKEILSDYNSSEDLSRIKGIAYLENGKVRLNEKREFMDLSECGMPAYHKIDTEWYRKPTGDMIRKVAVMGVGIYRTRGCPFNCSFCAANTVWSTNIATPGKPVVRKRPLSRVMDELKMLQNKYGFEFFYLLDDTFGAVEKDLVDFCTAYRDSGLKMLWAATTRVDRMQKEYLVKLLKESGCMQLDFGIESGSPKLLKLVQKRANVEQTIRACDLCRKNNMRIFANMLVNLPGEEKEDVELTRKLLDRIKPTYISIGITQPYPGTDICKDLSRPVSKHDYHKFSREGLTLEDFRLANHKLDLQKLLFLWRIKYGAYSLIEKSLFMVDRRYWSHILKSGKRWKYIRFLLMELVRTPLRFAEASIRFLLGKPLSGKRKENKKWD